MGIRKKINLESKWTRRAVLALLAIVVTSTIWSLDHVRQVSNQTVLGLRWARQIAVQADTLALTATEHMESDPLAWAARILTQGTDSRIIYASKFHSDAFKQISTDPVETYSYDGSSGVFEYTKVLYPDSAMGVRIKLYVAHTGIFGAKTLLTQDVTLLVVFLTCFSLGFLLVGDPKQPPAFVLAAPLDQKGLTPFWGTLVGLGTHIREMVRAAQKLSSTAVRARQEVGSTREKLRNTLTGIKAAPKDPNEMASLASEAQKLFSKGDSETKELIRKLLKTTLAKAERAAILEAKLEEALNECDRSYEALSEVGTHAQEMSAEITKTSAGIIEQSKMMEELKKRVA